MLEDHGWELARTKGSHRQYRHRALPGVVTVSGHPGADIPPGTLASILRSAGLKKERAGQTREEVMQLIKEAIEFHIEGLHEHGDPVPPPASRVEYVEVHAA